MSKFENVLKAQKVRNNITNSLLFRCFCSCQSFVKNGFFRSLSLYLCIRVFLFLVSSDERSDVSRISRSFVCPPCKYASRETKQFYQQQHKHVHLKGTTDMISSVGIPLAMAAGAIGLLAMGLKDLATGSNKKDGF